MVPHFFRIGVTICKVTVWPHNTILLRASSSQLTHTYERVTLGVNSDAEMPGRALKATPKTNLKKNDENIVVCMHARRRKLQNFWLASHRGYFRVLWECSHGRVGFFDTFWLSFTCKFWFHYSFVSNTNGIIHLIQCFAPCPSWTTLQTMYEE